MTRRRTFDPTVVTATFWRRDDVRLALARREIGRLFAIYLNAHPDCTQTQLALITEHDRSDISNFVRGTRSPRVADIDVLGRVADGLAMPDESRVLLGLAPAAANMSTVRAGDPSWTNAKPTTTGWFRPDDAERPLRIALCGSRSPDVDGLVVDAAVVALSRLLMNRHCTVDHGPIGVGIEIMTYIADHFRPPNLQAAVGLFGRHNVVRRADYVVVIGGGAGTLDEIDLAIAMGKRILPLPASGGAARHAYQRLRTDPALRSWLSEQTFAALDGCATANAFTTLFEQILTATPRSANP